MTQIFHRKRYTIALQLVLESQFYDVILRKGCKTAIFVVPFANPPPQ
jgi:hypothetical protein